MDFYKILSACHGNISPIMRCLTFNASDHFVEVMQDRNYSSRYYLTAAVIINGDQMIDENNPRHAGLLLPSSVAARAQVARIGAAARTYAKTKEEMDGRCQAKIQAQADKRQAKEDRLAEAKKVSDPEII